MRKCNYILALDGEDLRSLPLSMRKTNLTRLLARRPDGMFIAPFEQCGFQGWRSGVPGDGDHGFQ
jgi:hypothetical protein